MLTLELQLAGCHDDGCDSSPGRIWMFSLNFDDFDDQGCLREVVLSGGDKEDIKEINVHRMAVLSGWNMEWWLFVCIDRRICNVYFSR